MVTQEQQSIIDHAQLQKINGWQHIKVKGTPYECGFQEGYLLADEYQDALRVYKFMTLETFGMTYEWFAEQALKLHCDKIPTRWLEELRGMAEGLTAAGIPTTTDDMIAWNDWMEITGYWWPQNAGKIMSRPLMKTHRKEHCSAIVATGSATVDGKPYLGHESFDEFWSGQYFNICKRVEPDDGYAFIMQASGRIPGRALGRRRTVAVRVPANPIPVAIVRELGVPMVTASVKDPDEIIEYTTDPELIYERYRDTVDAVVDGGYGNLVPTTMVDLTSGEPEILREGGGELV